ncbi:MAG: hypothetical protein NTY65_08865 [Planctomycetota bacterium]|nr:hypothetical protein [Planctomycetota bacterium]
MKTPVTACRAAFAMALACLAAGMAGCGLEHTIFGTPGAYLLSTHDMLALPGEQVSGRAGRLPRHGFGGAGRPEEGAARTGHATGGLPRG